MPTKRNLNNKTSHPSKGILGPSMQMVTVGFNEASVDSPSFRASTNYYDTKVQALQDWINTTVDYVDRKYKAPKDEFTKTQSIFLRKILPNPTLISNGLVANQSFAPKTINGFEKDYSEFIKSIQDIMFLEETNYIEALLELLTDAVEPYNMKRKNFEYYQNHYDTLLKQTLDVPTTTYNVKPAFLKDEEDKLFDVRRSYIDASLNLMLGMSSLRLSLDKFLVKVIGRFNEKDMYTFKESGKQVNLSPMINHHFKSYFYWVKNAILSFKAIQQSMHHAKSHVYNQMIRKMTPSDDQNDYVLSNMDECINVPSSVFLNKPIQKNDSLFMKTFVGQSNREIWVQRWCSLDEFMFGMFLLSPSKTYVEETDKFGIGLINLKYPSTSSRRFCFDLEISRGNTKINPMVITFQAKNITQLKSWILEFSKSKLKYQHFMNDDLKKSTIKYAQKRYSPRFSEFASTTSTFYDQMLTTSSSETISLVQSLKKILDSDLITEMIEQKTQNVESPSVPMTTQVTPLALMASPFSIKSYKFLDAVQANIWGLNPVNQNGSITANTKDIDSYNNSANNKNAQKINFPKEYSMIQRIDQIQFKTIFESINYNSDPKYLITMDETLLFKVHSFWALNKNQRFLSVGYITRKYMYNYLNLGGIFHLSRKSLTDFDNVEYSEESKIVELHEKRGFNFRMSVYSSNFKAVAAKYQYLIDISTTKSVKSTEEILAKFKEIDKVHRDIAEQEELVDDPGTNKLLKTEYNLGKTFWNMDTSAKELMDRLYKMQDQFTKTYTKNYNISSKGLMHILFGDNSTIFPSALFLADNTSNYNKTTYWKQVQSKTGKIQLVRQMQFKQTRTNNFLIDQDRKINLNQKITEMVENRYYQIEQESLLLKVPFCNPIMLKVVYIITEPYDPENSAKSLLQLSTTKSKLYIHYKIECTGEKAICFFEKYVKTILLNLTDMEFSIIRKSIHYYLEKIGPQGKLSKVVKLCGLIGISMNKDVTYERKENLTELESLGDSKSYSNESETFSNEKSDISYANINKLVNTDDSSLSTGKTNSETIYGSVIETFEETSPPVIKYDITLLIRLTLKLSIYRCINTVIVLLRAFLILFSQFIRGVKKINYILLFGLVFSLIYNSFITARSGVSYWSVKKADNLFQDIMKGNEKDTNDKALYIKDLDLLTNYLAGSDQNEVYLKYKGARASRDNQFRNTRGELAIKRNELLVELRILQNMEKELVQGDYRGFLVKEIENCKQVTVEFPNIWNDDKQLQKYCNMCRDEYERFEVSLL